MAHCELINAEGAEMLLYKPRDQRVFFNLKSSREPRNDTLQQCWFNVGPTFSPLNSATLLNQCVLRQGTLPSTASLHSGVNEYLVGQRRQLLYDNPASTKHLNNICTMLDQRRRR